MATLVRWDPFREVAALQNEMGRFLNLFREGNGSATPQAWAPPMDVWETEGDIVYLNRGRLNGHTEQRRLASTEEIRAALQTHFGLRVPTDSGLDEAFARLMT